MSISARVIRPGELTSDEIERWRTLQGTHRGLWSPFFSPEFTLAVGAARSDARVAVLSEAGETWGFFPFHVCRSGIGKPIGGPISDYQGVIADPARVFDAGALLAACGLSTYDFNHLPSTQASLRRGALHVAASPHIDVSAGYQAYVAEQSKKSKDHFKKFERRLRKMERELGPVRLEVHDDSAAAWDTVVAMKNASYRRMGVGSILDVAWVARTLAEIRATRSAPFAGMLSTLYAGDRPVAAHFGMRSATTLHWWFNTYDHELRAYAPGLALLLLLAQRAPSEGLSIIDFGRGDEDYKLTFANGTTELCEGSIELPRSLPGTLRLAQKAGVRAMAQLPLGPYASLPRRVLHRLLTSMWLPEEAASAKLHP